MYKLSCVKFLIALAAVCPAVLNAQEQPTYTDLYYNKDLNTTGWSADRYMQNPAAWNVGSPDIDLPGNQLPLRAGDKHSAELLRRIGRCQQGGGADKGFQLP